jgi:hypothetical protein
MSLASGGCICIATTGSTISMSGTCSATAIAQRALSKFMELQSIAPSGVRYHLSDWGWEHFNSNVANVVVHVRGNRLIHSVIFGNLAFIQETCQGRLMGSHRTHADTEINLQWQNKL